MFESTQVDLTNFGASESELEEAHHELKLNGFRGVSAEEHGAGLFYTEGSEELREARVQLAKFSIGRAQARLAQERARMDSVIDHEQEDSALQAYLNGVKDYDVTAN